jgi:GNAT superfamily N-acetyltransferase
VVSPVVSPVVPDEVRQRAVSIGPTDEDRLTAEDAAAVDRERPMVQFPSGAVVRAALESDLAELLRLVRELAAYEKEPDAVEATEDDYRAILFPPNGHANAFAEVIEVDGRLVAMAFWYVTFSTWSGRHGIWLEDFFVEPDERGHGFGHVLLSRLARICLLRGYPRLEWWVLDWNQDAIDFYQRRGARALGEWTHYRVDGDALARLGGP